MLLSHRYIYVVINSIYDILKYIHNQYTHTQIRCFLFYSMVWVSEHWPIWNSAEMDYKLPNSGHERASVACLKHHLVMWQFQFSEHRSRCWLFRICVILAIARPFCAVLRLDLRSSFFLLLWNCASGDLGLKQFISLVVVVVFVASHDICCSQVKSEEIWIRQYSESQKHTLKADLIFLAQGISPMRPLVYSTSTRSKVMQRWGNDQRNKAAHGVEDARHWWGDLAESYPMFFHIFLVLHIGFKRHFFSINSLGCDRCRTTLLRHCQRGWEVVESAPTQRCAGAKHSMFHVLRPWCGFQSRFVARCWFIYLESW